MVGRILWHMPHANASSSTRALMNVGATPRCRIREVAYPCRPGALDGPTEDHQVCGTHETRNGQDKGVCKHPLAHLILSYAHPSFHECMGECWAM
jgi:hypothetical protein